MKMMNGNPSPFRRLSAATGYTVPSGFMGHVIPDSKGSLNASRASSGVFIADNRLISAMPQFFVLCK